MIAPLLEKFSTEYSNVNFIKVDVDESGDIAQQYEVSSMPTLIFFKNGEIVQKLLVLTHQLSNKQLLLTLR